MTVDTAAMRELAEKADVVRPWRLRNALAAAADAVDALRTELRAERAALVDTMRWLGIVSEQRDRLRTEIARLEAELHVARKAVRRDRAMSVGPLPPTPKDAA